MFKICESFSPENKSYSLPNNGQGSETDFNNEVTKLNKEIKEISHILETSSKQLESYLQEADILPGFKTAVADEGIELGQIGQSSRV